MQSDFIKKPKIYVYVSLLWFIMWGLITAIVFLQMLSDGDYTYLFTCFLFLITIIHSIYSLIYTINFSIKILDEKVIKELLLKHKHCCSDLTYIKGIYNDIVNIPNIFVIDKDLFLDVFNNEFYPKNIDINKVIDSCVSKQKFLQFIDPVYVYKISTVPNQKSLDDLETLLINRK